MVSEKSGLPSHGVDSYLATYFGMTPRQIKRLSTDERELRPIGDGEGVQLQRLEPSTSASRDFKDQDREA